MTDTKAAGLGAELRSARQAQGWELPQLAASLRIRQSYLEAIEAGRVADLPGTTYALGFVRAYASALGLPGEEVAKRFRSETTEAHGEQPPLRFPAPVPQRGVPAGALMLLGVAILAAAYGGWYWVTEHRATPVEIVPPIPDRMAAETQKPLPSPQVASLLPSTAPPNVQAPAQSPAQTASRLPATAVPVAPAPQSSPPNSAAPASGPGQAVQPQAPVPLAAQGNAAPTVAAGNSIAFNQLAAPGTRPMTGPTPGQMPPQAATAAAPPVDGVPAPQAGTPAQSNTASPPGTRIVIRATADAWVTVKQKAGPPLFNKLMHAGDSWPVPPNADGATLTTGNAGGTQIDVDGKPIPASLGASGAVRRDLPMDPAILAAGTLPPMPARHRKPAAATPVE